MWLAEFPFGRSGWGRGRNALGGQSGGHVLGSFNLMIMPVLEQLVRGSGLAGGHRPRFLRLLAGPL